METKTNMPGVESLRILREDYLTVGRLFLCYRLEEQARPDLGYYVRVSTVDDEKRVYAGPDILSAAEFYGAVLRGSVTPCTLLSVAEDFETHGF